MIKHSNIIYMPTISPLGGIETYVYEMVKKYKDLDIAVVSIKCDPLQAERIKKYCPLYIHKGEIIECDVAIINYDTSIINYISKNAKIYQTIHGDYTHPRYNGKKPPMHPRITGYIAITKFLQEKIKELLSVDNVLLSYNPLTVEKEEKPIIIVSPTRLHKYKGGDRVKAFINEMDKQNKNYLLFIITNEDDIIKKPNVIFIKNRLDISRWLEIADYVLLFSDSEACSYTLNEALYRNIPILCTPLPYLTEIGVKNGKNAYVLEFDCSNVEELVKNIENIPKFEFKQLEDDYKNILVKSKSKYKEMKNMKVVVQALINFYDMNDKEDKFKDLSQVNKDGTPARKSQHIWIVDKERADYLVEHNAVKIIEEVEKDPVAKEIKIKKVEPILEAKIVDADKVEVKPKRARKKKEVK